MKIVKKITFLSLLVLGILFSGNLKAQGLNIGDKAPMLTQNMEDVSGRNISLSEVSKTNGLLVIFSSNTCPWVTRWEDRYIELGNITRERNIGMVALNSNEASRDRGESMVDMKKRASKKGYNFPYTIDFNHAIADAFGATKTPHVFLFNKDMVLVYSGAIDDNANSASEVKEPFLKNAIQLMSEGKSIEKNTTNSLGCTIKRTK